MESISTDTAAEMNGDCFSASERLSNGNSGRYDHTAAAKPGLKITIAGAGIGGLAAAIGLRRQGHLVTVFEQAGAVRGVGYGIHLAPNGVGLLRKLGVDIEGGKAVPMNAIRFYKQTGEMFSSEDRRLTAGQWQHQWFLASRVKLHEELVRLATADDGEGVPVQIRTSCRIIHTDLQTASATLEDGTVVLADIILGADGVHSKVRDAIVRTKPYPSRYNCFRMILNREDVSSDPRTHIPADDTMDMIYSPRTKTICYPILDNTRYNCVMTHLTELTSGHVGDAKARMMELCSDHDASFRKLLDKADPEKFRIWPLYDMDTLPTFAQGRLAILGDAAHPFTPHLAQGGVMALEDAASLSVMLSRGMTSDEVPERLGLFNQARHERGTFMQKLSLLVGGDRVDDNAITGDGKKGEKQTLNVQKYLDQALSHDEGHASSQLLREWRWKKQQPCCWSQPTSFGPAPVVRSQGQDRRIALEASETSADSPTALKATVTFKTSGTLLKTLFPTQRYSFPKVDTVVLASVEIRTVRDAYWLPGLSYNSFTIFVHNVQYDAAPATGEEEASTSATTPVLGTYCLATFINSPEAIIHFREKLGLPALFSDITCTHDAGTLDASISWRGTEWASFKLRQLRDAESSVSPSQSNLDEQRPGILVHKYIPTSIPPPQSSSEQRKSELGIHPSKPDADYTMFYPPLKTKMSSAEVVQRYTVPTPNKTNVEFHIAELSSPQLPTLHHVTERLAEIPVFAIVDAEVTRHDRRGRQGEVRDWERGMRL